MHKEAVKRCMGRETEFSWLKSRGGWMESKLQDSCHSLIRTQGWIIIILWGNAEPTTPTTISALPYLASLALPLGCLWTMEIRARMVSEFWERTSETDEVAFSEVADSTMRSCSHHVGLLGLQVLPGSHCRNV